MTSGVGANGTPSNNHPIGTGASAFFNLLYREIDARINTKSLFTMWATYLGDGRLRLDNMGDELLAGDWITLEGSYFAAGDRVICIPISSSRGQLLVFGRPQKYADPAAVSVKTIPIATIQEITDSSGYIVHRVFFSRAWVPPGGTLFLEGYLTAIDEDTVVTVSDEIYGTLATATYHYNQGKFSLPIPLDNMTIDDLNRLTITFYYADFADPANATVELLALIIKDP